MNDKLKVGIACNSETRKLYVADADRERLESIVDLSFVELNTPSPPWSTPSPDPQGEARLREFAHDLDVLIVSHGAPLVSADVINSSPKLRVIGDIEGDRFGSRIDMEAARAANITVVDTSHSSSWPVSEWALALILLGLRQQGRFRDIIGGKEMDHSDYRTNPPGRELSGKTVGLIGFGHIAWKLRELLLPFGVVILAHDPFAPRELADAMDVDFVPLHVVLSCGITVCLAPETPSTIGMIGGAELDLIPPDGVFVNVSRGTVVDREALEIRAARNDAWFGIDAHDPEPISVNSPLRGMRNVFLSPHIAGMTVEAQERFFSLMVNELERIVRGGEPRAQLTPRVLEGRGRQQ